MHSWARYLVHEAQEQLHQSYQLQYEQLIQQQQRQQAQLLQQPQDTHRDQDLEYGTEPIKIFLNNKNINEIDNNDDRVPLLYNNNDKHQRRDISPTAARVVDMSSRQSLNTSYRISPSSSSSSSHRSNLHNRPFSSHPNIYPAIRQHIFHYNCNLTALELATRSLLPSYVSLHFIPLIPDTATKNFLIDCCDSHSSVISLFMLSHTIIKPILSMCLSHTNVNGILGTGQMFLLSTQQFQYLYQQSLLISSSPLSSASSLSSSSSSSSSSLSSKLVSLSAPSSLPDVDLSISYGRLLDVGAGSGGVTAYISPLFTHTVVTEVSWAMCRLLRQAAYTVYKTDTLDTLPVSDVFDVICCFNVLDRCMLPLTLLAALYKRLADTQTSRVFLATPLPLDPWCEVGKKWILPEEHMAALHCCDTWELSVTKLSLVFMQVGFRVLSVSRLPYISQGNQHKPFFVLDDALFVLAK